MIEQLLSWYEEHQEQIIANIPNLIMIGIGLILLIWLSWYFKSKRRRRHFRFHWHHFMYTIGVRKIMSRHYVGRVHVHECFDPLVDFLPHKHIIFNKETLEEPILIRKQVLFKLYRIADSLPEGVNLKIYKTFRSRIKMSEAFEAAIKEVTDKNHQIGRHEAIKMAKFKTDDPKGSLGGHETGGAVDVALCDDNGVDHNYGTKFHEYNDFTFTYSSHITKEQKKNRKHLVKIMRRQGFVNFPGEWWHFSYGDRMWAAYKGKRDGGIYGSAETEMGGHYGFTIPVNRTVHETHQHYHL